VPIRYSPPGSNLARCACHKPEASGLTAAVSSPTTNLPNFFESRVLRGVLQPPTPRSILAWSSCSNRWLLERVRAMLHQADLLKTLWAEATHFAV
jgi:hypothetical protein